MKKISYASNRFPPEIIQQVIRLYSDSTLSFRDVEHLLAERGIMVSYPNFDVDSTGGAHPGCRTGLSWLTCRCTQNKPAHFDDAKALETSFFRTHTTCPILWIAPTISAGVN
jgi:hypothetical protein